jgi:hypothetical protein
MTSNGKPAQLPAIELIRQAVPIETRQQVAAETLSPLYGELNNHWAHVQQKLRDMLPPRECWAEYRVWGDDEQYRACIGLVKWRGEWRICHGFYDAHEEDGPAAWKPIHDCSVSERVELIDHIEKLRDAIIAEAEKSIPQVQSAVSKLATMLKSI